MVLIRVRPVSNEYRWHLEKNATQMPAISWQPYSGFLLHVLPAGSVPSETRVAGMRCCTPSAHSSVEKLLANGSGWLWKQASVKCGEDGHNLNW